MKGKGAWGMIHFSQLWQFAISQGKNGSAMKYLLGSLLDPGLFD